MVSFPKFISDYVPFAYNDTRIAKSLSGLGIAIIEAFILCPVERMKTYLMTNSQLGRGAMGIKLKTDFQ